MSRGRTIVSQRDLDRLSLEQIDIREGGVGTSEKAVISAKRCRSSISPIRGRIVITDPLGDGQPTQVEHSEVCTSTIGDQVTSRVDTSDVDASDDHTMYIYSGVATGRQVHKLFRDVVEKLGVKCDIRVTMVISSDLEYQGYCHVWLSSSSVYHAIFGRGLDGSCRVETHPDPDWKVPDVPYEEELARKQIDTSDWAFDEEELKARYQRPLLKRDLPPLVTIDKYIYTDEQKALLDGEEWGIISVKRMMLADPPDNCVGDVLCSTSVPRWITDDDVGCLFTPFCRVKDVKRMKSTVFITFYSAYDAAVSYSMNRRVVIKGSSETCIIFFRYKTRR